MKEIGGYIELDVFTGPMFHEHGIKLNCGRNALAYLLEAKRFPRLWMPKFMCDSCDKVLKEYDVDVQYYSIGMDFKPQMEPHRADWLYIVNFYGQLSNTYMGFLGEKVIVDNAQSYFQPPVPGVDTLYTCRKFFGVADGAILYTDQSLEVAEQDESFERMHFLLGRFERPASEFYSEYVENNRFFQNEPIKRMSKITENLLHGIDYSFVAKRRTENFSFLNERLSQNNKLHLSVPNVAFMYPYYVENGAQLRKRLQEKKIFIPTLWPAVLHRCKEGELEYDMALNILPIPVDQRYGISDMEYIVAEIKMHK